MKNYIIRSLVAAIAFTVVYVLFDLIIGDLESFRKYAVQTVIFGVLFGLFGYLEDKGWISWKKVGALFKRKTKDE